MENPSAQRDDSKQRMEIVFSIIAEFQNELEKGQKPGDATQVKAAAQKEGIEASVENMVEDLIQTKVKDYDCKYDPETGLSVRIVDGKVIKVNEKVMKEISEDRKRTGKTIKTVKGPKIDLQTDDRGM